MWGYEVTYLRRLSICQHESEEDQQSAENKSRIERGGRDVVLRSLDISREGGQMRTYSPHHPAYLFLMNRWKMKPTNPLQYLSSLNCIPEKC